MLATADVWVVPVFPCRNNSVLGLRVDSVLLIVRAQHSCSVLLTNSVSGSVKQKQNNNNNKIKKKMLLRYQTHKQFTVTGRTQKPLWSFQPRLLTFSMWPSWGFFVFLSLKCLDSVNSDLKPGSNGPGTGFSRYASDQCNEHLSLLNYGLLLFFFF